MNDFAFKNNPTMYLFFGQEGNWPAVIDITNKENITIPFLQIDHSGGIKGAGDINNDGIQDIAFLEVSNEHNRVVIYFGKLGFENIQTDLSEVDGSNGIYIS